MYYRTL